MFRLHGEIKCRGVEGQVVHAGSLAFYRSLNVSELECEIGKLLRGIEGGLGRTNELIRSKLIAALDVLKPRIPRGEYQHFLKAHHLNPATVRTWRARGRGQLATLCDLLGDPCPQRQPKKKEPLSESTAVQLAKAAKRLAEAVLGENQAYAVKLAREYLDAYEEAA